MMDYKEYLDMKKRIEEYEQRDKWCRDLNTARDCVKHLPDICMVRDDRDPRECTSFMIPNHIREYLRAAMLIELQKLMAVATEERKAV